MAATPPAAPIAQATETSQNLHDPPARPGPSTPETVVKPGTASAARGPARLRRLHARLLAQTDRLVALAGQPEAPLRRLAEGVSGWSAAQHLEHLMLANRAVLDRLEELLASQGQTSAGAPAAGGISLTGRLVLWLNYIPRGSARATTPIQPKSTSMAPVGAGLSEIRRRLGVLGGRLGEVSKARGTAQHLIFGGLDASQWVRFLEVHNHHHLKIIGEIQAALSRPAGRLA